ncbi:glycoside hydrolase [Artomyces pyxidatus]|uniref:Glycoside hydrolase n=1 Tax=Artomyces pyxidatus TaxID=48021 RepID=A0ACB8TK17_9AGAM|nr:glycoside hydrolase [Artomyces pyxidatus]
MAYYPDWVGDMYPPEKVDFSRIDWIDFAFAVPDANCNLGWDGAEATAPGLLQRLVAAAHAKGKKVKLSVGGWTGSKYFSPAVSNDQNRHTLVNNIVAMYKQFQLDGIDIDWEYPGQPGNDGNAVSSVDTTNFLSFLTLLRSQLPPTARISAAAQTVPFAGPDGQPVRDVSPFVNVLDWVLLMNYDVWGSSDMPGPNAPLSNACHNSTQPGASADAAINAWTAAGFPPQKLVLGVPSYGYVSRSAATRLRQRRSSPLAARSPDDPATADPSDPSTPDPSDPSTSDPSDPSTSDSTNPPTPNANTSNPPTPDADTKIVTLNPASGQIQYRDLLAQGALCAGGARGCGGFTRYWDACSSTPFLRSARAGQVVAYDDAQSLALKAQLARARGLRGVNMFDVAGDTYAGQLVDALRRGLGLQQ